MQETRSQCTQHTDFICAAEKEESDHFFFFFVSLSAIKCPWSVALCLPLSVCEHSSILLSNFRPLRDRKGIKERNLFLVSIPSTQKHTHTHTNENHILASVLPCWVLNSILHPALHKGTRPAADSCQGQRNIVEHETLKALEGSTRTSVKRAVKSKRTVQERGLKEPKSYQKSFFELFSSSFESHSRLILRSFCLRTSFFLFCHYRVIPVGTWCHSRQHIEDFHFLLRNR